MNMQFANIAMMSEVVVTTTFTIELEERNFEMDLCIPYSALEPIRDLLTSQMQGRVQDVDIKWIETIAETVHSVELELVANLGAQKLFLENVVALKIGDFIPLEYDPLVTVTVDNVPLLQCRYGTFNKKYALRIEKFLQSNLNEYVKEAKDE
jgi:flagellar motor switch protein FliM